MFFAASTSFYISNTEYPQRKPDAYHTTLPLWSLAARVKTMLWFQSRLFFSYYVQLPWPHDGDRAPKNGGLSPGKLTAENYLLSFPTGQKLPSIISKTIY